MYRLVSSANKRIVESMSKTISLIYTKNSSGPIIDPCGTPALIETHSDLSLGNITRCL